MDNRRRRRRHTARRRKRRRAAIFRFIPLLILLLVLVIAAIIFASSGVLDDLSYSDKKADISSYFSEKAGSVEDSEAIVVKDGQYTDGRVRILNGVPYIQYDTVKSDYISRFYRDNQNDQILYTNATETIRTSFGSNTYGVTGVENSLDVPTTVMRGETLYMSFDYLSLFMTLGYNIRGGNDGTPYRIEVYTEPVSFQVKSLSEDKAVRVNASKKAEVLAKPGKNAKVRILGAEDDDWQQVMTEDMLIGYIETKHLQNPSEETISVNEIAPLTVPSNTRSDKVVLGWTYVAGPAGNDVIYGQLDSCPGMNVISPTWFYLADNDGNVGSFASKDVVKACHNKGIDVWGMVDNFTNSDITTAYILSDNAKRRGVIEKLISLALEYGLDGLNIDFESLPEEAGEPFIQFIRELSIECRANNLILSIDNYVPKAYTNLYNRKEQGVFADYVVIMGYDEHINSSEEIGSVASIGFVKEGIEKTLEEVPANKVLNALPFYTRMWRVSPSKTEVIGEDGERSLEDGYVIEEVQTLPLQQAIDTVASHSGAEVRWDTETMQNYAEWPNSGERKTCIWLEDAQSLDAKLQVMTAYNIGGAAVWQIGYGEPFAWETIRKYY